MDENKESQAELIPEKPEDGETQPKVEPEDTQSGAEVEPSEPTAEPVKTYTEEEVAKREADVMSKAQAETEQYKKLAGQLTMQQELARLQAVEEKAQAKDAEAVAAGDITQDEADRKREKRQEIAQLEQTIRNQRQQAEQLGRITLASDLGEKYGIDPKLLLSDTSIKNPLEMYQKAADLAIKAAREEKREVKPESFDAGPGTGGAVEDDSNLSAKELARKFYAKK